MKVQVVYNLDDEWDTYRFKMFKQLDDVHTALEEYHQYLRQQYKYSEADPDFETVREKFYEILSDNNVDLSIG